MNTNFKVFSLTQPGIELKSSVSFTDALSTKPLAWLLKLDIGYHDKHVTNIFDFLL